MRQILSWLGRRNDARIALAGRATATVEAADRADVKPVRPLPAGHRRLVNLAIAAVRDAASVNQRGR